MIPGVFLLFYQPNTHFPLVKSGISTTAPPLATDISDRAVIAIQEAAS